MRAEPEELPVIVDETAPDPDRPDDPSELEPESSGTESAGEPGEPGEAEGLESTGEAEGLESTGEAEGLESIDDPESVEDPAAAEATEPESEPEPESGPDLGPGEELDDEELLQRSAALLFASPEPLSEARLRGLLEKPHPERVRTTLEALTERLAGCGLPIVLRPIAGGWRLLTDPAQAGTIAGLVKSRSVDKISPAALETLSIVAYRQPVTKAEIEAIRGVDSGAILRSLVDRGLAKVAGRADQPGSPLQYGTTRDFLDRFGLASLKDLPRDGELVRG